MSAESEFELALRRLDREILLPAKTDREIRQLIEDEFRNPANGAGNGGDMGGRAAVHIDISGGESVTGSASRRQRLSHWWLAVAAAAVLLVVGGYSIGSRTTEVVDVTPPVDAPGLTSTPAPTPPAPLPTVVELRPAPPSAETSAPVAQAACPDSLPDYLAVYESRSADPRPWGAAQAVIVAGVLESVPSELDASQQELIDQLRSAQRQATLYRNGGFTPTEYFDAVVSTQVALAAVVGADVPGVPGCLLLEDLRWPPQG